MRRALCGLTWHFHPQVAASRTFPGNLPSYSTTRLAARQTVGAEAAEADHLRLEWRQGHVVVGDLGTAVYPYEPGFVVDRVPARPNTATQRYFPQTGHLLQGDFLRFWQTHGGLATFGAPISGILHEPNGDGSRRVYAVQWFEKARLERHPETHHPRFAILLGLVGRESVYVRGWLPPRHHRGRGEQGI
jgi:hypothetical protein